MHPHHIMCFSSTLICFLVVTCHGAIINKYQNEVGHPDNENNHKFSNHSRLPDDITIHHHHNSSDIHSHSEHHHENSILDHHKDGSSSVISFSKRLRRSADTDFPQAYSNGKSNFEQSSIKKRSKPPHDGSHHRRHNDSDHDHSNDRKNHPDFDYDAEESYEDPESVHLDGSSQLPSLNEKPDKATQTGAINPCVNSHDHEDHDHEHHEHSEETKSENEASNFHQHAHSAPPELEGIVWLYASLAVVAISLCGLFSVAVIPIMQKWFYHTLLQFLVGLAVGSLSGDGLLHLMPHAFLDSQVRHDHKGSHDHHDQLVSLKHMEEKSVFRGLAALSGIFLFFIAERLLGAVTTYRKQKRESKLSRHPKHMLTSSREDGANNGSVGEKLAQPKKNSYDHIREKDEKETIQMLPTEPSPSKKGSNQSIHEVGFHGRSSFSLEPEATVSYRPDSESSVIVSDHHGHAHAHTHEIPQSVSAVAWMVILGDGLHNFCDGLAIGAAFASGTAGGISTTVAVFCHELPHELGDFAMLLKTGMKVKQALFYNGLSSVLCFIGMIIGVTLGNVHSAINWVFAGTAGMFLYIALVDMLPELTIPANTPGIGTITTLIVQVLGIFIGVSVMLLIALYEAELHSLFSS
ncbi:zinc transporter foi [Parasteatoda tepidariorum]|nr:zinc transporter foi [Parasteatoda tepidariorum]